MSYPSNPGTIIVKNSYYNQGLKEIDIWNYYQKWKNPILNHVGSRDVAFVIMADVNEPVIKRKTNDGKYIKLTTKNYDTLITGRTIAIYSVMRMFEDFAIVDIDTDSFKDAKIAVINVWNSLMKNRMIDSMSIRYTGKTGFHIIPYFGTRIKLDRSRDMLHQHLSTDPELKNKYTISPKRTKGIVNIDLWASNKVNGAFISLHSLSIWGLRCVDVPYNQIMSFNQQSSKIQVVGGYL